MVCQVRVRVSASFNDSDEFKADSVQSFDWLLSVQKRASFHVISGKVSLSHCFKCCEQVENEDGMWWQVFGIALIDSLSYVGQDLFQVGR